MVTYTIDTGERLIRTRCTGMVTVAEVSEHFRVLAADPACPSYLDVLLDLRSIDSLPERGQLQAVSAQLGRVRAKVRFGLCAIVVEKMVLYGIFRMFAVIAQDHFTAIQVFRDIAEAEWWLASKRLPAMEK